MLWFCVICYFAKYCSFKSSFTVHLLQNPFSTSKYVEFCNNIKTDISDSNGKASIKIGDPPPPHTPFDPINPLNRKGDFRISVTLVVLFLFSFFFHLCIIFVIYLFILIFILISVQSSSVHFYKLISWVGTAFYFSLHSCGFL